MLPHFAPIILNSRLTCTNACVHRVRLSLSSTSSSSSSSMAPLVQELHFPNLKIPVTIDNISTVMPAGPIPVSFGDSLYLSNLDDMVSVRMLTPTVYFYSDSTSHASCHPAKILRNALAEVLVPYYPFSGRLREAANGKLEVFFGAEHGALMVEAHSETTISGLGDLDVPNPAWWPLIYRLPSEQPYEIIGVPLLIAQVTTFACGGFSLGLRLCHCLCDGPGAMQLMAAWAASARAGSAVVTPEPCWDREFFRPRHPPLVEFPHHEFAPIEDRSNLCWVLGQAKLVQRGYRLSREFLAGLKLKLAAQSTDGCACTTFDALASHLWRSWLRALRVGPTACELRLTFSVNLRPKLTNPELRDGFYGNAVCVGCATSTVAQLLNRPISDTARLVREARTGVTEEYARSTVDYIEVNRPKTMELAGKLTITQWTRLGLYESADFGWGRPDYAGPVDLRPTPQCCVFLPHKDDVGGSMVVWICLPESSATRFKDCLLNIESGGEL